MVSARRCRNEFSWLWPSFMLVRQYRWRLSPNRSLHYDPTSGVGETLSSLDVAGRFRPVVPVRESSSVGTANPVGPDGPVVAGSPIGPCETVSPLFHNALG